MKRFRGKYRTRSLRLPEYDYASPGWYFVTVCTKGHRCFFGEVRNGTIGLSDTGCIVAEEWQKTAQIRSYVVLDEWIIMPNHIHGILGITSKTPAVETPRRGVSTNRENQLKAHSLGAIIGQFKSVCTKRIRRSGYPGFAWQSGFYDHIVRSEQSLQAIRRYVADNPLKWHLDRNHPNNIDRVP